MYSWKKGRKGQYPAIPLFPLLYLQKSSFSGMVRVMTLWYNVKRQISKLKAFADGKLNLTLMLLTCEVDSVWLTHYQATKF